MSHHNCRCIQSMLKPVSTVELQITLKGNDFSWCPETQCFTLHYGSNKIVIPNEMILEFTLQIKDQVSY